MRQSLKYLIFFLLLDYGTSAASQEITDLYPAQKGSLICWKESRTMPRPLKIYYIRVDLTCPELEVITLAAEDPDGGGPAESNLTLPGELFSDFHALAAINANAFAGLPGTYKDTRGWYRNRPVDVQGMAVSNGRLISPVQDGRTPFRIDSDKRPHIGNPSPGDSVWQAVSDWSGLLLTDGLISPDSSITTLHPRTSLGFDESGRWLLFIVVDGRQPGISEGISLYELASLFRSKGCTQAINLDGGGSSILLVQRPDGTARTVNSPSGILHRPVPVMLGVRKKG